MKPQHLSDEAVAAFADGVLAGHARERARRHTADCPECAYSVAVQREAVWALRAAPAPSLPIGLFDRLLEVPISTPIRVLPTSIAPDGSTMFATLGSMVPIGVAAAAPVASERSHRLRPIVGTAAAVAVAGVLAVSSAAHASSPQLAHPNRPASVEPANFQPVDNFQPANFVPAGN